MKKISKKFLDKINEENQTAGPSKRGPSIFNSQSGPSRWTHKNGQKTNGSPANSASSGQSSQNSAVRKIGEVKLAPWEQNLHPQSCTCQECVVCPSCNDKFETKRGLIIHFSRLHRDQIKEPPTYPPTHSQNNQTQMVKVKVRKVCLLYCVGVLSSPRILLREVVVDGICVGFNFLGISSSILRVQSSKTKHWYQTKTKSKNSKNKKIEKT